jgi:transketolase
MVNAASSGHQGAAIGFSDVMAVLFNGGMNFDPLNENRDRLILSNGHASAMLYSAIFLSRKTPLTIDDLKNFRTFGGICQGHPVLNKELGIEMTTGALGQGLGAAVGIAIALKKKKIDSKVFVIVGDGCLMEGISHEAMTLAASLNLDNLIILFDDNDVCIDGRASSVTTDNFDRVEAYGWSCFKASGHSFDEIEDVIFKAKKSKHPAFVSFKTIIGKGTANEGTSACHGICVDKQNAMEYRRSIGFPEEAFSIPYNVGPSSRSEEFCTYPSDISDVLKDTVSELKKEFIEMAEAKSTRYYCGKVLERLSKRIPILIGGSSDLSESNCTISGSSIQIRPESFDGNYINYGVKEHAMGCVMNGLAIEGFIPFGGTFLVFSNYMLPAIRNAAIMKVAPIFVFTHDSVAVGEDGVTHQPIEQLAQLRAFPNLNVFRPCCGVEVVECIELAIQNRKTPSAIALSRQNLPYSEANNSAENKCSSGMYVFSEFDQNEKTPITIIATGSEVALGFDLKRNTSDYDFRIISAPCFELFDNSPEDHKKLMLSGRKIIIEAGSSNCLYKYKTQEDDIVIGIDEFGTSGSPSELFKMADLTVEAIMERLA